MLWKDVVKQLPGVNVWLSLAEFLFNYMYVD